LNRLEKKIQRNLSFSSRKKVFFSNKDMPISPMKIFNPKEILIFGEKNCIVFKKEDFNSERTYG